MSSPDVLTNLNTGSIGPSWWPCCGVTAVAVVAGVTFDQAYGYMGRNHGRSWKGVSNLPERRMAMDHFGVIYGVPKVYYRKRVSFKAWMKTAKPGTTYMIDVTGHTMVYRDGFLIDQSRFHPVKATDHPASRKFMWSATEIMGRKGA